MDVKLGSMGKPLPGIRTAIIDDAGNELPPIKWQPCYKKGWPSMMCCVSGRIQKNINKDLFFLETGI